MNEHFFLIVGVISMAALVSESFFSFIRKKGWYNFTDLITNLNVGVGQVFVGLIATPVVFFLYNWIEVNFSFVTLGEFTQGRNVFYFGSALLLVELCQYWGHRTAHEKNFFIAGHITHHTSHFFNISTAFRISWFYRIFAWVFFIPLALIGIPVLDFVLFQVIMNGYNLLMHTRINPHYGWLGFFLLTPENHRIHHCRNDAYIGKNYGAMFIIFDRIFGTYAAKQEGVEFDFGYDHDIETADPFSLNFHYLKDCWLSARKNPIVFIRILASSKIRPSNFSKDKDDFSSDFSWGLLLSWAGLLGSAMFFTSIKEQITGGQKTLVIAIALFVIWLNYRALKTKLHRKQILKTHS